MLDENKLLFDELYEKTRNFGRVQFVKLLMAKEREIKELKKQLDELQTLYNNMFKCHCNRVQVETLLSQQKEFIEYLEKEIQRQEDYAVSLGLTIDYDIAEYTSGKIDALKESLSKYKEIITSKNGN